MTATRLPAIRADGINGASIPIFATTLRRWTSAPLSVALLSGAAKRELVSSVARLASCGLPKCPLYEIGGGKMRPLPP